MENSKELEQSSKEENTISKQGGAVKSASPVDYLGGYALIRWNDDKEGWSPIPKNMRHEATVKVGSFSNNINSKDTFRALSPLMERILLPVYIGLQPTEQGWQKATFEYWCDWEYMPTAKGIILDYRTYKQTIEENGEKIIVDMPVNVDDYINYHMLLNHPYVAKEQEDIDSNTFDFELVDLEKERIAKNEKYMLEEEIITEFTKLVSDIEANRNTIKYALNLLKDKQDDYDETRMTDVELKRVLKEKMDKPIEKINNKYVSNFLNIVKDKYLKERSFLAKCVEFSIIKLEGNTYFFGNEKLGISEKETIHKLTDPRFSSQFLIIKERLNNKITKLV